MDRPHVLPAPSAPAPSASDTLRADLERIDVAASRLAARSARLVEALAEVRAPAPADAAPVSLQLASANRKLNPIRVEIARSGRRRFVAVGPFAASTYASISRTCPETCTFKDNGCFAQAGASHLTMGRLDRAARRMSALEVSRAEAKLLAAAWPRGVPQDGARGGRDLRLHVGGDVSCERGARALARAVVELRERGLGAAWTYTHRWREIPRHAWGPIHVLASCETEADVREAAARGYAAALTVDAFPQGRRAFRFAGQRAVPCPFESGAGPTCVQCRLCLDRDLHRLGIVIVFSVHGALGETAVAALRQRRLSTM